MRSGLQRFSFAAGVLVMVAGAFASVELTSSPASAQGAEEITGVGTPTFIPQFIGRHTLANSNIFQTGSRIGVNTTNPATTLDVESNDFAAIKGATSSNAQFATGVFGQTASANAGIGVDGENFATSGVNHGVLGRSFSTSGIGVGGIAAATTGNAYGVFGSTDTTGSGAGVFGSGNATDGTASGVAGQANSPAGNAILGVFAPSTGGGGGGATSGGAMSMLIGGVSDSCRCRPGVWVWRSAPTHALAWRAGHGSAGAAR